MRHVLSRNDWCAYKAQTRRTYRCLNGHDGSRSITEIPQASANTGWWGVRIEAVLVIDRRADKVLEVLRRDMQVDVGGESEGLARLGRDGLRLVRRGGLFLVMFGFKSLRGHSWCWYLIFDGGSGSGRSCISGGRSCRGNLRFRLPNVTHNTERSLPVDLSQRINNRGNVHDEGDSKPCQCASSNSAHRSRGSNT